MKSTVSPFKFPFVLVAFLTLIGCNSVLVSCDATQPVVPSDHGFESVDPSNPAGDGRLNPPTAGAGGSAAGDGDADGDPDRAIEEADIVKIEGDTLYALSQFGGLSTIDISQPDRLRLLGRHKTVATPFEMYVRDGIVLTLYQGYGEYIYDEDNEQARWVQTSEIVIVDARQPETLTRLARFDVPGSISDSRVVGNVLYVASFEDGYCWGCRENAPRTVVSSLDIRDSEHIRRVDQLSFDERTDVWSWRRSISVTDERMYVSGPTWSDTGPVGSTIQVVDIADPDGSLREGAVIEVAGQINNRWQMDELNGVLRVITQPFAWNLTIPPTLQTFTVESSDSLVALGQVTLTLPRPEQLQSVRFDGARGYAITSERTDPLITLDLTDPAHPTQAGLLEMPGWVYHMEPRGDRVLGLGFDQAASTGALTVSLFDVSDLQNPTMLDRVNFGGDWAWLAEDQDRIHKAFNILDDAGLILVPFSGFVDDSLDPYQCAGGWQSGVQLVDWNADSLQLRGVAPARSQARRGFLHDERLFAMSDERVEAFDITDRDHPVTTSTVSLAQNISFVAGISDERVVRVGQNWWTGSTQLDLTDLAQAEIPVASGTLEVDGNTSSSCYSGEYLESILVDDDRANLVYSSYDWDPATGKGQQTTRIATVDVANETPELIGDNELDMAEGYYYYYPYGLIDRGARQVIVGTTLAAAETQIDDSTSQPIIQRSVVHVVDLSNPQNIADQVVNVPSGLGVTGLVASGNIVARSHYEESSGTAGSVRFYLDRIDVSNPNRPTLLPKLNIPGSLLAFDARAQRALTVDYSAKVLDGITASECYQNPNARFDAPSGSYDWSTTPGRCTILRYALNLLDLAGDMVVVLGHHDIPDGQQIGQMALGDDRVFFTLSAGYGWGYGYPAVDAPVASDVACYGGCFFDPAENELPVLSIAGLKSGAFAVGRLDLPGGDWWSYSPIAAAGTRAVVASGWRGKVHVIEADDATNPSLVSDIDIAGYVQGLAVVGNTAIASLGLDGVQLIDLQP
ncbi:MAG TPA: beta-propeller domain-containing protein [Polyangiaceae bacterium]|nr:beta-propeller domain-containing protein [Polyangiaceae bacterium]